MGISPAGHNNLLNDFHHSYSTCLCICITCTIETVAMVTLKRGALLPFIVVSIQ